MALIGIFLITNDGLSPFSCAYWQYIILCELSLHTESLFLNLVVLFLVIGVLKIHIQDINPLSDICNISPILWLAFSFLNSIYKGS